MPGENNLTEVTSLNNHHHRTVCTSTGINSTNIGSHKAYSHSRSKNYFPATNTERNEFDSKRAHIRAIKSQINLQKNMPNQKSRSFMCYIKNSGRFGQKSSGSSRELTLKPKFTKKLIHTENDCKEPLISKKNDNNSHHQSTER